MKQSFLALLLAVFVGYGASASAGDLEDGSEAFIKSMADEAVASLTDTSKPREARVSAFRKLFEQKFAVDAIGRWTLGRNWRNATTDEQRDFLGLFEELMVATYVDRFQDYSGEELKIIKTVPVDENRATVHTEITRPNAADTKPISVLWRVGRQGDIYKVLDVVVEGASMSVTLQREFASIIKNTGSVGGLIEELRKKTQDLNSSGS